jgi:regulator of protease activity HflC (stomatin/prohibitin superfamily)
MQASNQRPRLPTWIRIAIFLFAVLLILLIYSMGSIWVGHVVFFLAALAATWLLEPNLRPLARTLVVLISMTLVLTTAFVQLLNSLMHSGVIQQNTLLHSFLDEPEIRLLVSLMGALAISIVMVAITLAVAVWTSAEWILALREVEGVTLAQALRLLVTMMFRTAYAWYVVENGKITETKPKGMLPALGGPGKVVIRPYNAVIFERSGEITRIEGPGLVITDRFEMHKAIFDLRKQWITWRTEELLTRDHVPLRFNCGVGFRIESARETVERVKGPIPKHLGGSFPDVISGDYKVYQHTLYRAVYETTEAGWQTATRAVTETMLLNIVREYTLENFYRLEAGRLAQDESIMDKIVQETMKRTNKITPSWGVTVTAFKITNFEAPQEVKEKLLEMWAARYAERSKLIEAEAERGAMVTRGEGQAAALAHVENVKATAVQMLINQLLRGMREAEQVDLPPEVIERFARVVEQLSSNLVHDDLTAPRYIEALEKIAASETTKTIALGSTMLDPGVRALPRRRSSDLD